jgi:outer membrane murein-binding lipoprotein Lpp
MTDSMWVSIGSMLITLLGLVGGWFLIRPQTNSLDSSTAEKYQQIADKASDKIDKLQARLDKTEADMRTMKEKLEAEVYALKIEARSANERAERFENWAKRLVYQVRSMGGVPVELDPTRPING